LLQRRVTREPVNHSVGNLWVREASLRLAPTSDAEQAGTPLNVSPTLAMMVCRQSREHGPGLPARHLSRRGADRVRSRHPRWRAPAILLRPPTGVATGSGSVRRLPACFERHRCGTQRADHAVTKIRQIN
jgi:hypothetical protein